MLIRKIIIMFRFMQANAGTLRDIQSLLGTNVSNAGGWGHFLVTHPMHLVFTRNRSISRHHWCSASDWFYWVHHGIYQATTLSRNASASTTVNQASDGQFKRKLEVFARPLAFRDINNIPPSLLLHRRIPRPRPPRRPRHRPDQRVWSGYPMTYPQDAHTSTTARIES
jgi:hypothetical protein